MDLISPYYKHLLNRLHHQRPRGFGNTAWLKGLEQFTDGHKSFLDYGCGKGNVVNGLKERYPDALVRGYDPGMPDFDKVPDSSETYEFLLCTDVLEHIEPDRIDNVLQHINFLFTKKAYLMIDTVPARKFLPDGRNMLAGFHTTGKFRKVLTTEVEMTPTNSDNIALNELNKIIAEQKGVTVNDLALKGPDGETVAEDNEKADPVATYSETTSTAGDGVLDDNVLAAQYRSQADALFKEAKALREQAEELVPTKRKTKKTESA